jgi:prepilin-type N-terminal cleavage/methylation domain-containing protein
MKPRSEKTYACLTAAAGRLSGKPAASITPMWRRAERLLAPVLPQPGAPRFAAASGRGGFTLPEIMVATGVFGMLVIAMLTSQIFSLRLFNIAAAKLGASAQARNSLNRVRDEVRMGKTLYVGTGDASSFTRVSGILPRRGNALQVFPTANSNVFTCFYLDPAAQKLMRRTNGAAAPETVASYITNTLAFQAEDYAGNTLTNDQNNRVVKMTLEFYQWECPSASSSGLYNHYHLQTRMTRRTID